MAAIVLALNACMSPEEQGSWELVNNARHQRSIETVHLDEELSAKARAWAAQMARAGRISHSNLSDGITQPWARLGENVGRGPTMLSVHQAFMESPQHYGNIVDRGYDAIGIGVAHSADGSQVYVAQVFMQRR